MALYIIEPKPHSIEEFEAWCNAGYTGSWERYLATPKIDGRIFLRGDLGAHCADCAEPHTMLCDYPVGDGKTCDRPMCAKHSHHEGKDTDYCHDHFILWREYLASERGYDVLANVTPIGPKP